jgi:hypothetical protein
MVLNDRVRVLFLYNQVEALGLQYLSKSVRAHGHETALVFDPRLFDFFRHDYNNRLLERTFSFSAQVIERVDEYKPNLIGFSVLTANYHWVARNAEAIRKILPGVPIVAGGYHASANARAMLETGLFDYIIRGDGEDAFTELVDSIEDGAVDLSIKNLAYLDADGEYVENALRPYEYDLDRFGMPDKELFHGIGSPFQIAHMSEWRRGCPWGCTFCGNNYYRKMYFPDRKDYMFTRDFLRSRSVDDVLAELRHVKAKYNPCLLRVNDDDICADEEWLAEMAEKMTDAERIPFKAFVIPNNLNERTVKDLVKIGCEQLQMGVQSLNSKTRKLIGRPNSNEQIARAIDLCRENGIGLYVDQIFGLPGENEDDCAEVERFYLEHPADFVNIFWLDLWAGADIVQQAVNAGTLTQAQADNVKTIVEEGCISTERSYHDLDFAKPYAGRIEIRNHFSPRMARFLISTGLSKIVIKLNLFMAIRVLQAFKHWNHLDHYPPAREAYDISWVRYPRLAVYFIGLRVRSWFSRKALLPITILPPTGSRPAGQSPETAPAPEGEMVGAR